MRVRSPLHAIVKRTSHLLTATYLSIVHRPSMSMFASDNMLSNDIRRSLLGLSVARCDTDDRDRQQHTLPPSPPSGFMRCSFGRQTEIDGGVHHQEAATVVINLFTMSIIAALVFLRVRHL